jgi:outer membrane protein OmpA-like peptidoglycan-associated protein
MRKIFLLGAIGLSLGTASTIYANENNTDTAGQFYISPTIGAFIGNSGPNTTTAPAISLSFGYNFTRIFALQATGSGWQGGASGRLDSIWNIPLDSKIMPYLAVGLGYLNTSQSSLAYDVGGGIKYNLTQKFNVNVNYRYIQGMRGGMPGGNLIDVGFSVGFGGADSSSQNQEQREEEMHKNYVLPKNVMECSDETPESVRESIGCYTFADGIVTMHLDSKFGFNQSALTSSSKKAIDNLVSFMQQYPDTKVVLRGYASSEGTDAHNKKLSEERAAAVSDYLESEGIAENRISTVGYGEEDPIASNNTATGREINRRVETSVDIPAAQE